MLKSSPDDHNLSHFTEDKLFTGTGKVTAFRDNFVLYVDYRLHSYDFPRVHAHFVPGDIDTNRTDSPYYNGDDTALTLDIEANAEVEKHTCWARKKETTTGLTVSLKTADDIIEAGSEFTVSETTYIAIKDSIKVHVYNPVVAQKVGVKAGVNFDKLAVCSAFADFDFNEDKKTPIEFDEGSVWYHPPPNLINVLPVVCYDTAGFP